MARTYEKVPFVWEGGRPVPPLTEPPATDWLTADREPGFLPLVGACLAASDDPWACAAVAHLGPDGAAALVTTLDGVYEHRPEWWQVLRRDGVPVGYVLPVVFTGCARDGLDEGTITHIGVRPSARGRGYGRLLLRRATATLERHGVWRIYCDTAAGNAGMIRLFETEGWTREPTHHRPVYQPPSA